MKLSFVKKYSPRLYRVLRSTKENINISLKLNNLKAQLKNDSKRLIYSLENEDYFKYKEKIFKTDKLKKRDFAYIEINNSCNINCTMCDTKSSTRQKKLMKLDLFEKSVQDLEKLGINKVSLHTIGDPLSNPKIGDILNILRKYNFTTSLSSNGLMLNLRINELIKYIDVCSDLRFSIDGVTKETYERIRFGGKWEDLLKNLELAFEKLEPKGYRISIDCVISKDNVHEAGEFLSYFGKKFKFPHDRVTLNFINSLSPNNDYFNNNNLLDENTHVNKFCTLISNPIPYILVNGELSVCCRDYDGSLIVGDIKDKSIPEIIKDEKFSDLQRAHENINSNMFNNYNLCSNCYHVDDRVCDLFKNYIKNILVINPRGSGEYYQKKINFFINMIKNKNFQKVNTLIN